MAAQRAPHLEAVRPNRIPPHNLDAEQSVLGAMLESREAIANVIEVVMPDDFYKPAHTEIYDTILALHSRGEPVDAITVADELGRRGTLDNIGGKPYISGLLEAYPTASAAGQYARIVEEHALLRRLISAGNEIQAIGFNMPEDVNEAVDEAEELIYNVGDKRLRDEVTPIKPLLGQSMEQIEHLYERGESVTGVASGFADLDDMTTGFQPQNLIIVAARPSMGKCLSADSLIDDPRTGERLTIAQFVERRRPMVVSIGHDGRLDDNVVADWIPNGRKECFRLTTRTGRSLDATANHPVLKVHGWTPLADLAVGDSIAVPRRLSIDGDDDSLTLERIRLLGYFIAEGGLTGNTARFTNTDPEIISDFEAAIEKEFPDVALRRDRLTLCARSKTRSRQRNSVTLWLDELGLMGKSALQKRFPACVWRFSRERLAELIRAVMSCDGTVYSMGGYPRIEFAVASEGLAQDVHHALLRLNVMSKLWRKTERCWRVEITEPRSVQTYQELIGWIGEKRHRIFRESQLEEHRRSNRGFVPIDAWDLVKKACDQAGVSLAELSRRAGEDFSNVHANRGLRQDQLSAYAEILGSDELRWLSSDDLYWDEIVSIEPIGVRDVFDIEVPYGNNFVAQDICVHNSALMSDFALNAAMRNNTPVVIFNLEMSKLELTQRFLAAEARVDSQRLRKGTLQEQDWAKLSAALGRLAEAPIFIDDSPNVNLMEMRAKCRRLKGKHGLGLVIIDYLQLMQSPRKSENRQQEVSEISRNLKIMAKELNVPVVCASQLNRGVEYRADKRPFLGDLRESGCLTGETLVALASGARVPIIELVGTTPEIATLDGWSMTSARASKVWRTGTKAALRMTLASGRTVRATGNHPFLLLGGWKALDELEVGDRIGVPRNLPAVPLAPQWEPEKLVLLAHLLGDGSMLKGLPLRYASISRENLDAVSAAASHFGVTTREVNDPAARSVQMFLPAPYRLTHGKRNPVVQWLDGLGLFDKRSHEKFVPEPVFELSNAQIGLFLQHLWATDGCVWNRPTDRKGPRVSVYYATNSRRLADDVQSLLQRLGILSSIKKIQKDDYKPGFHVVVQGSDAQRRFVELVGGFGPRSVPVELAAKTLGTVVANTNQDTIPVEIWERVKDRMKVLGITQRQMQALRGVTYGGSSHFRFAPSRSMLEEYAALLDDPELKEIAASDLYWDSVVSIEPDGVEDVYDMTVPGTHNFVANGIVCHNSIEQDADMVMFIYRDEVYNPDTDRRGEAELIVAKHRNGPVGTVNLAFMNQYTKFASIAKGPGI